MDFTRSENQIMLSESIDRFLTTRYDLPTRRALLSDAGGTRALWQEMAELGWIGAAFAEDQGGFAESALDAFVVMEGLGRHLVTLPYLTSVILCGGLIGARADLVEQMIAGKLNLALMACGNAPLHSPMIGNIIATKDGAGYRLNGRMSVVLGGDVADKFLVEAGGSLFIVDADQVSRRSFRMIDATGAAEVEIDSLAVGAECRIGDEGAAISLIQSALDRATIMACGEALGSIAHLIPATASYIKTREQYGAPLAKFQVLQHRMAEMFIASETARSMALVAAMSLDTVPDPAKISSAKAQIGRAARYVGTQAVQLHGGMGVSEELNIGHHYIRLNMIDRLFGDRDFHLKRYADLTQTPTASSP
jgi:alkylation response protein AidB-like acyl-CoA dehydrogenase